MKIDIDATQALHASMPFIALLGLQMVEVTAERAVAIALWSRDKCTGNGVLHGGSLMSVADTLGAICAGGHLPPNSLTTTIESKTNFIRTVTQGEITITSTPVHAGRLTIVVQRISPGRTASSSTERHRPRQ